MKTKAGFLLTLLFVHTSCMVGKGDYLQPPKNVAPVQAEQGGEQKDAWKKKFYKALPVIAALIVSGITTKVYYDKYTRSRLDTSGGEPKTQPSLSSPPHSPIVHKQAVDSAKISQKSIPVGNGVEETRKPVVTELQSPVQPTVIYGKKPGSIKSEEKIYRGFPGKPERISNNGENAFFSYGVVSDQGNHRPTNEDAEIAALSAGGNEKNAFFAVFDGHGGFNASRYATNYLYGKMTELGFASSPISPDRLLKKAVISADEEFVQEQIASKDERTGPDRSGTTVVAALITDNDLLTVANLGDSRAVLCEKNSEDDEKPTVRFTTKDHKPGDESEKERIEAAGSYVEFRNGFRVGGTLALSRALGDIEYKKAWQRAVGKNPWDKVYTADPVSAVPDVTTIPIAENTQFLVLACDGLWDVMSSKQAVEAVWSDLKSTYKKESHEIGAKEAEEIASKLVTMALGVGSTDNVSVIVVFFKRPKAL